LPVSKPQRGAQTTWREQVSLARWWWEGAGASGRAPARLTTPLRLPPSAAALFSAIWFVFYLTRQWEMSVLERVVLGVYGLLAGGPLLLRPSPR
jgi:hypothetical protein